MRTKNKLFFWLTFTITFIFFFILVFSEFIFNGISFINYTDGLTQHYSSLIYFSRWLKLCMESIAASGTLEIPMWDLNIGMGSDIISTLSSQVIGNPVNWLSGFVPYGWLDYLYSLAFAVGLYAAGIGFACFSLYHKNDKIAVVLGAMLYCFCGFALQKGIQHTFFLNAMIYFPFILWGIDKIYDKKSPAVFCISTAMAAISYFYFFYMIFIFIILYIGYRFFTRSGTKTVKAAVYWLGRFGGYGLIAMLISAVVFLPSIIQILGSNRIGVDNYIPVLYSFRYYQELIFGYITNEFRSYDSRTGYAGILIIAILLLFIKKGNKGLKVIYLTLTAFLCIPYLGSVMNGFGYVSNRWIFVYSMLLAYIFVKVYPSFFELDKRSLMKLAGILAGYCLLGMMFTLLSGGIDEVVPAELLLLIILMAIIISYLNQRGMMVVICSSVTLGILFLAFFEYSMYERNAVASYVPYEDTYQQYDYQLPSNHLKNIADIDDFRSLVNGHPDELRNSYMLQGLHGIDFYFSVTNSYISQYLSEMYYNSSFDSIIQELDDRIVMETLLAVKYSLVHPDVTMPQKFTEKNISNTSMPDENIMIYENPLVLPFSYTYSTYIPRERYEAMTVTDKQESMLYGIIVDEDSLQNSHNVLKEAWPSLENREIDYDLTGTGNINISDKEAEVLDESAKMTILCEDIPADSECYIIIEGLNYEGIPPQERFYSDEEWDNMSKKDRKYFNYGAKNWVPEDIVSLNLSTETVNKKITYLTNRHKYYGGKTDYLCNLGQLENKQEISITFSASGRYSWSDLRIVIQPLNRIKEQTLSLSETQLTNLEFGTNRIKGTIACDETRILCLAVPYSDGWKAYVDGKEQKVLRANTMFLGLELDNGQHQIEFRYTTPGIKIAVALTLFGILLLIAVCWYPYLRKHLLNRFLNKTKFTR